MHQPVYIPYYDAFTIVNNNGAPGGPHFSFSLFDMWCSKSGPYKTWPTDAVEYGLDIPHLGAQVDLSGSLIEALNNLEYNNWNNGFYSNWKNRFNQGKNYLTSSGNPRLDIVIFPYHHPILPLLWKEDIRLHIKMHKYLLSLNFPGYRSKGLFPPEACFSERIIPALVAESIEWVIVDNIHISRTLKDYPYNGGSGVVEPNPADQQNGYLSSKPHSGWVQLYNLWAPEKVAAGFAYRPHYASFIDPETGEESKIIVVPAACYEGNEDARGGFGALLYEQVFSQLLPYNTDPLHPILILLHHDGENYGAGTESYYHSNFSNYCNWLRGTSNFSGMTIQDYLTIFPVSDTDVIHIENGGWIGSGCLDPEFKKWLGDGFTGYSPDWNSWAIITAAHNWVWTANSIEPFTIQDIINNTGNNTSKGFHYYLSSQTSCYEYWEGSSDEGIWNSNPARACNLAIDQVYSIVRSGTDTIGPSIFVPQREPYNPGGKEFGEIMDNDFMVWSFIYDLNGIKKAIILYRLDDDSIVDFENRIYAGEWDTIYMDSETWVSQTNPQPYFKARRYYGYINGKQNVLIDYFVEAQDSLDNVSRSDIMHVWVGSPSNLYGVLWTPEHPDTNEVIRITINSTKSGWLHWGVNGWNLPDTSYWPIGSSVWNDSMAIESPLSEGNGCHYIDIGPFYKGDVGIIDFVIHFDDNTWDNNNGKDYHIPVKNGIYQYQMDGILDPVAIEIETNSGYRLWAHTNGDELYVATQAGTNFDHFIFISLNPGILQNHPWLKNGRVAQWDAYLGNEQSNGWCGWFDLTNPSTSDAASGDVLEGFIDLYDEFGFLPDSLFISACGYETQDYGSLVWQVPGSSGSYPQDIEMNEFKKFRITTGIRDENSFDFIITKNIFNDFTDIFIKGKSKKFYLEIYDITGRVLFNKFVSSPYRWKGEDNSGKRLKSGLYFIRARFRYFLKTEKVVLL